tara:strand:- start:419 stop:778 length:360 start_codon:yes stop_codon:yes gene_type:complete
MPEAHEMIKKLKANKYKVDDVKPINPRQTLTDEELIKVFLSMEGNYYEVNTLKEILVGKVKINTENPNTSIVSSTYLARLSKLTGNRWRQKRALGKKNEMLIKFYTDGRYSSTKRRRKS